MYGDQDSIVNHSIMMIPLYQRERCYRIKSLVSWHEACPFICDESAGKVETRENPCILRMLAAMLARCPPLHITM